MIITGLYSFCAESTATPSGGCPHQGGTYTINLGDIYPAPKDLFTITSPTQSPVSQNFRREEPRNRAERRRAASIERRRPRITQAK